MNCRVAHFMQFDVTCTFYNVYNICSFPLHFILLQVVPTEQELPGLKQDSPPFILIAGELHCFKS